VLHSAFFKGMITAIMLFFLIPGLVYGMGDRFDPLDKHGIKQMITP
jgi:p-aminobenzoyl-glutamate transporter AbgT